MPRPGLGWSSEEEWESESEYVTSSNEAGRAGRLRFDVKRRVRRRVSRDPIERNMRHISALEADKQLVRRSMELRRMQAEEQNLLELSKIREREARAHILRSSRAAAAMDGEVERRAVVERVKVPRHGDGKSSKKYQLFREAILRDALRKNMEDYEEDDSLPWTKIDRRYIDAETLRYFELPFEIDPLDENYYIIREDLGQEAAEILFKHVDEVRRTKHYKEATSTAVRIRNREPPVVYHDFEEEWEDVYFEKPTVIERPRSRSARVEDRIIDGYTHVKPFRKKKSFLLESRDKAEYDYLQTKNVDKRVTRFESYETPAYDPPRRETIPRRFSTHVSYERPRYAQDRGARNSDDGVVHEMYERYTRSGPRTRNGTRRVYEVEIND